jgi:hypothetical protein
MSNPNTNCVNRIFDPSVYAGCRRGGNVRTVQKSPFLCVIAEIFLKLFLGIFQNPVVYWDIGPQLA